MESIIKKLDEAVLKFQYYITQPHVTNNKYFFGVVCVGCVVSLFLMFS